MLRTVLVEEKRRKIVKASKSHFWEYCPGRLYPAYNTSGKSRLPTLVLLHVSPICLSTTLNTKKVKNFNLCFYFCLLLFQGMLSREPFGSPHDFYHFYYIQD